MGGESKKCDQYTVRTDTRGVVISLSLFVSVSLCLCFPSLSLQDIKKDAICKHY